MQLPGSSFGTARGQMNMVTATQPVQRTRQAVRLPLRQGTGGGHGILPFPLPEIAAPGALQQQCCLWCQQPFTPVKPNQLYCKRKHSQYASQRRKDTLITALADLLQRYGAKPATAQLKATEVVEVNFYSGRIQRTMQMLGYRYDDAARMWVVNETEIRALAQ